MALHAKQHRDDSVRLHATRNASAADARGCHDRFHLAPARLRLRLRRSQRARDRTTPRQLVLVAKAARRGTVPSEGLSLVGASARQRERRQEPGCRRRDRSSTGGSARCRASSRRAQASSWPGRLTSARVSTRRRPSASRSNRGSAEPVVVAAGFDEPLKRSMISLAPPTAPPTAPNTATPSTRNAPSRWSLKRRRMRSALVSGGELTG
jgi:hypothetical protein